MNQHNIRECPKCKNSYFILEISWMGERVDVKYICEGCNWSTIKSNCTSPSSSPDPFCSNQTVPSEQQTR
jgi:hypothetical protein